jgi:hypothetical protein
VGTYSGSGQSLGSSDSFSVALGDVDNDGDLDAFVANISSQANKVWLYIYYCFADIDEDGDVDEQDLAVMASEYGHSDCEIELMAFECFADIEEDGDVDGRDLAVMASEFGHSNCEI